MSNCSHEAWDFGALQCPDCGAVKGHVADADYAELEAEVQALREEVAALRARVVVSPDFDNDVIIETFRRNGFQIELGASYSVKGQIAQLLNALEELARLNGMTVSEGLVQGMAKFAQEIICGALDGGSFDGADIQESAERHRLIAKQVMNEPCRGPEEYCACAWSTSFPAECYRVTPEIRALLSEQDGGKP